jgi:hypothetical protein
MQVDGDIIAVCFLYKDGDENNKALLSTEKLYVTHKKRTHEYELGNIKDISFNHRKLMMPLIVGGIMASLGMVAVFRDYFNPYIVVSTILIGLSLFYWGWTGQLVFTVHTKIKEYDFSIPSISDNLNSFTNFLIESGILGRRQGGKISYYLAIDKNVWNSQPNDSSKIILPDKPYRAYLFKNFSTHTINNSAVIEFDPLLAKVEIRYLKDPQSGKLVPFVMGDIDKKAVLNVTI